MITMIFGVIVRRNFSMTIWFLITHTMSLINVIPCWMTISELNAPLFTLIGWCSVALIKIGITCANTLPFIPQHIAIVLSIFVLILIKVKGYGLIVFLTTKPRSWNTHWNSFIYFFILFTIGLPQAIFCKIQVCTHRIKMNHNISKFNLPLLFLISYLFILLFNFIFFLLDDIFILLLSNLIGCNRSIFVINITFVIIIWSLKITDVTFVRGNCPFMLFILIFKFVYCFWRINILSNFTFQGLNFVVSLSNGSISFNNCISIAVKLGIEIVDKHLFSDYFLIFLFNFILYSFCFSFSRFQFIFNVP